MTKHISDERLAELKAGLEGVTPGPWGFNSARFKKDGEYDCAVTARFDGKRQCIAEAFGRITEKDTQNATALAAHIANCDPDTIASLIARLEAAEANVDQLRINLEHAVKIIEKHVPIDALGEGGGICPEPGMPDQTRPLLEEYLHYMREALSKTATKTIEGDG